MGHEDRTRLVHADVEAAGLADWRLLRDRLHTRLATGDFATGLALVTAIGEAAEAAGHHPDIDLSYPHVVVRLSSHDVGGVTARDVRLARRISEIAAEMGIAAQPQAVGDPEPDPDTPDRASGQD